MRSLLAFSVLALSASLASAGLANRNPPDFTEKLDLLDQLVKATNDRWGEKYKVVFAYCIGHFLFVFKGRLAAATLATAATTAAPPPTAAASPRGTATRTRIALRYVHK